MWFGMWYEVVWVFWSGLGCFGVVWDGLGCFNGPLPDSLISSAEDAKDCVAKFTSLVRARD